MTDPRFSARVDLGTTMAMLDSLSGALKDVSPVFRGPVDAATTRAFVEQFASKGVRLNGAPWQPLSLTTIRLRTRVIGSKNRRRTTSRVGQARAGFATPLQNTRRMWASFVKSGGPESLRVITPNTYERGSRVRYAALHQTGFTISRMFGRPISPRNVPARPIVPAVLPTDLVAEYEDTFFRFLQDGTL